MAPGQFVYGSASYVSDLVPILEKALESKGYLPRRDKSPWRDAWQNSPFEARLVVNETKEGNYMSSENRMTLIHIDLTVNHGDRLIWHTTPRARSVEPLPALAGVSGDTGGDEPEALRRVRETSVQECT